MKDFKNSTRTKYYTGEGGAYNERGQRATWDEVAAEGRRVENEMAARTAKRKPPVEGISTRPTTDSGRRMTNAELGITPGGVAPKKPVAKKALGGLMNSPKVKALAEGAAQKIGVELPTPTPPTKGASEKPQISGGPVTDPRANIGSTLEIMKKQGSARELPTPTPAPKGKELPTPPTMVKGQKINVPPTRGPSMSPAFSARPMIRRNKGGLSVMPKGKC